MHSCGIAKKGGRCLHEGAGRGGRAAGRSPGNHSSDNGQPAKVTGSPSPTCHILVHVHTRGSTRMLLFIPYAYSVHRCTSQTQIQVSGKFPTQLPLAPLPLAPFSTSPPPLLTMRCRHSPAVRIRSCGPSTLTIDSHGCSTLLACTYHMQTCTAVRPYWQRGIIAKCSTGPPGLSQGSSSLSGRRAAVLPTLLFILLSLSFVAKALSWCPSQCRQDKTLGALEVGRSHGAVQDQLCTALR